MKLVKRKLKSEGKTEILVHDLKTTGIFKYIMSMGQKMHIYQKRLEEDQRDWNG